MSNGSGERGVQSSRCRIISQHNSLTHRILLLSLAGYKSVCLGTNSHFPTHASQGTNVRGETTSQRRIFPPPLCNSRFCSHGDTNRAVRYLTIANPVLLPTALCRASCASLCSRAEVRVSQIWFGTYDPRLFVSNFGVFRLTAFKNIIFDLDHVAQVL